MNRLIIKYAILAIAAVVISRIFTATIVTIWPDFLTIHISEGVTRKIGSFYIENGIYYLMNIIILLILIRDMKKENVKSIPVIILTLFSSSVGIIFFFFALVTKKLHTEIIEEV